MTAIETNPVEDLIHEVMRRRAALSERVGAALTGAVLCPSGTHGDFVDGEVVPGDLPCRECGAAL